MVAHKANNLTESLNSSSLNDINKNNNNNNLISFISQTENNPQFIWGGYYSGNLDVLSSKMLNSLHYDKALYSASIDAFKAHVRMCIKRSIIPEIQGKKLQTALEKVKKSFANNQINEAELPKLSSVDEVIKYLLFNEVGDIVNYLNVSYCKNEHEATTIRLWTKKALDNLDLMISNLQSALIEKAESNVKTIVPSYTHHQTSQATSLAHYMLSYVEAFGRDRERIKEIRNRVNSSPAGAYLGSGSSFEISRKMVARILDFSSVMGNSIDAINDRDFIVEFMSFASLCSTHLSKLAQVLLEWQHPNFNFICFDSDLLTQEPITGFSRYPEILEYIRSKSGLFYGNLINTLSMLKGLNNSFTRDLKESVEPMITTYNELINCINTIAALVARFTVNRKEMKEAAKDPIGSAPDILNWLLQNTSLNYTKAIEVTKKIITTCIKTDKKLSLLELDDLKAIEPQINSNIYSALISSRAVVSRRSEGATNPVKVRKMIRASKRKILA